MHYIKWENYEKYSNVQGKQGVILNMLKEQRQQLILNILKNEGKLIATDLSIRLNVSEDTIRRDLRELDTEGLLHRVHGGALPNSPKVFGFDERQVQTPEAKEAIALSALQLIHDGQVIIMDGSTTILRIAQLIPEHIKATIITNSPSIAMALSSHPLIEVIMIGGQLFKDSLVNIGAASVEALNNIRADLCFIGVYSIHDEIGISIPNFEETYVKKSMIENSSEVVALVTAEKIGTSSAYIVAPANSLTYLITEDKVSEERLEPYRALGISILKV